MGYAFEDHSGRAGIRVVSHVPAASCCRRCPSSRRLSTAAGFAVEALEARLPAGGMAAVAAAGLVLATPDALAAAAVDQQAHQSDPLADLFASADTSADHPLPFLNDLPPLTDLLSAQPVAAPATTTTTTTATKPRPGTTTPPLVTTTESSSCGGTIYASVAAILHAKEQGPTTGYFQFTAWYSGGCGTQPPVSSVYVNFGLGGEAVPGEDYTGDPSSVDITGLSVEVPVNGSVDVPFTAIDDPYPESGSESVWVTLGPGTDYEVDVGTARSDVIDNDPLVWLTVTQDYAVEGAEVGQPDAVIFTVWRSDYFESPLTVHYQLAPNGTAVHGAMADGGDYGPLVPMTVEIPAGADHADLRIAPHDDDVREWTEWMGIDLIPGPGYGLRGGTFASSAVGEFVDDDGADIVIQDLPEEAQSATNETSPGAFLPVNDDDDNENETPDNQEAQFNAADDDLEPVELSFPSDPKPGATVTLSMDPLTATSFRVWKSDGTQLLGASGGAGGALTQADLDPASDGPTATVYLEALAGGTTTLALTATDAGTSHPSNSSDAAKAKAGQYDLDVATVSNNAQSGVLDDALEAIAGKGAYLPVNNDDDDYSIGAGAGFGADKDQNGQVAGEDDLLPIIVRGIADANAKVKLTFSGVKVYEQPDRTGEIAGGQEFPTPQQDKTLYVEATSTGNKTITLVVNGKPQDSVRLKAFQWTGPLNVPQHGTFNYTVSTPPVQGAKWLNPGGGTITQGANTSNVDIQWGAGPAVGKAIYQATADYVWDLGVNVVEVKVENPEQGQAFTTANVVDNGLGQDGNGNQIKIVRAGTQGVNSGLEWKAKVTFNGPGGDRGVAQMRAGFVQNLKVTTFRGGYTNNVGAKSQLESTNFWDTKDRASYAEKFYSTAAPSLFEDADPSQHRTSKEIAEDDSPQGGPRTLFNGQRLTSMNLVWDFKLYVVALTKDTRNSANQAYTGQAVAEWQFNGSGAINPNNFAWTGMGAGVTAPNGWTALNDGGQLVTSGSRFNSVVNTAGWNAI